MSNFKKSPLLLITDNVYDEIRKIYNLNKPARLEEAINILEEWLQKQTHFVKRDYDKEYLEKTLIQCKGSVEKAKKQIDTLASFKTLLPKFFTLNHIEEIGPDFKRLKESALVVPLPVLTSNHHRVFVAKLTNKEVGSDAIMMYCRFVVIISEYVKAHDYFNAMTVVLDLQDINVMEFCMKINWLELQQFLMILIGGYGARVAGIYDITDSKGVEVILNSVKPLIPEKLRNRIQILSKAEDLQQYVPKEILPIEYGGNERSIYTLWDEWVNEVSKPEHHEYMKMMNKACTDERLRNSCKFNEEILGMPGSFRNLSVD